MSKTEAQLRANKKYFEKFDLIRIRVPLGEKDKIAAYAKSKGESVTSFVRRAIEETIKNDNRE